MRDCVGCCGWGGPDQRRAGEVNALVRCGRPVSLVSSTGDSTFDKLNIRQPPHRDQSSTTAINMSTEAAPETTPRRALLDAASEKSSVEL